MTTTAELTRDEFVARFKAEMLRYATTDANGESVADYADIVAVAYWEDEETRAEGPEKCARDDIDYWER